MQLSIPCFAYLGEPGADTPCLRSENAMAGHNLSVQGLKLKDLIARHVQRERCTCVHTLVSVVHVRVNEANQTSTMHNMFGYVHILHPRHARFSSLLESQSRHREAYDHSSSFKVVCSMVFCRRSKARGQRPRLLDAFFYSIKSCLLQNTSRRSASAAGACRALSAGGSLVAAATGY